MKPLLPALALLLIHPLCYAALCQPANDPTGAAPAHWSKWQISASYMNYGSILLGIRGERIAVQDEPKFIIKERKVQLEPIWADQVDWALYQHLSKQTLAKFVLYFDTDGQGNQRLCRIEEQDITDDYRERVQVQEDKDLPVTPPTTADLQAIHRQQWLYDANNRLLTYEQMHLDDESKRWQTSSRSCYRYNPAGAITLIAKPEGRACNEIAPQDIQAQFVYDATGHLLRSITSNPNMESTPSGYSWVNHPIVILYDQDGKPKATYREDSANQPYRAPNIDLDKYARNTWSIRDASALNFAWHEEGFKMSGRSWQIVTIPTAALQEEDSVSFFLYSATDNPHMLAKGKTDSNGVVNMGKDRNKVWLALQDSTKLTFFVSGTRAYLLTKQINQQSWLSCLNPARNALTDCP